MRIKGVLPHQLKAAENENLAFSEDVRIDNKNQI